MTTIPEAINMYMCVHASVNYSAQKSYKQVDLGNETKQAYLLGRSIFFPFQNELTKEGRSRSILNRIR